jgi:ATP dependent DNA ligase-like protein
VLPAGEKWSFELKLDGYRCIAVKRGKEGTLFSRHKKVLNKLFPILVAALGLLADDFVLDGELVALNYTREAFLSASADQPVPRSSSILLRIRFAKPQWRVACEFATFASAQEAGKPA